jgi:hypothetical protein
LFSSCQFCCKRQNQIQIQQQLQQQQNLQTFRSASNLHTPMSSLINRFNNFDPKKKTHNKYSDVYQQKIGVFEGIDTFGMGTETRLAHQHKKRFRIFGWHASFGNVSSDAYQFRMGFSSSLPCVLLCCCLLADWLAGGALDDVVLRSLPITFSDIGFDVFRKLNILLVVWL